MVQNFIHHFFIIILKYYPFSSVGNVLTSTFLHEALCIFVYTEEILILQAIVSVIYLYESFSFRKVTDPYH